MTEPWPQGICTPNFVKIGPAVPEICSRTDIQTVRHTDRQTNWLQYSTPLPGQSNKDDDDDDNDVFFQFLSPQKLKRRQTEKPTHTHTTRTDAAETIPASPAWLGCGELTL